MESAQYFHQHQKELMKEAAVIAEEVTSDFFKLSHWRRSRYDILTLEALAKDHQYLLAGGVFTPDIIETWIERKMKDYYEVRNRPHPYEMNLYYAA